MKTANKRIHLRWLVPLLAYFVVLAMLIISYRNYQFQHAAREIQSEMAFAIEREVDAIDFSVGNAMSTVSEAGEAFSLYAMRYNRNQITQLLKGVVNRTDLTHALVCDLEGNGYDYEGWDMHIGEEDYFSEVTAEYARGGIGMVVLSNEPGETAEICIVDGITFDKKEKGYIIAKIPVASVADQVFAQRFLADTIAIVTLDGQILSMDSQEGAVADVDYDDFWKVLPRGITRDNIKLSLSQNKVYCAQANGYGYVIVVPLDTVNGGAVAFVSDAQMKVMTQSEMVPFRVLAVAVVISSLILVALIFASFAISELIVKKRYDKSFAEAERDVLTGLLSARAAMKEIDDYIDSGDGNRGILFLIGLNMEGDSTADSSKDIDRVKDFAAGLSKSFRASDIIGRIRDHEFVVFLKDIQEEKDIRKQTDHMQMFLHDTKIIEDGKEISANAGASICPDSGKIARDALVAAESALERSRKEGTGRLSF